MVLVTDIASLNTALTNDAAAGGGTPIVLARGFDQTTGTVNPPTPTVASKDLTRSGRRS
jgi:hypothetical protein